jgi:hypothetical protein
MCKVHLFQYKSQCNNFLSVNPENQGSPIFFKHLRNKAGVTIQKIAIYPIFLNLRQHPIFPKKKSEIFFD